MRAARALLARLAGEDGIALVTGMMLILVIGIFSAVLAQGAIQVNDSSSRDRDDKRSLAAGESGLQSALARINSLSILDHQCLADGPVEAEATLQTFARFTGDVTVNAGECGPSSNERGGNGERFFYHVSPVLAAGANGCNNPIGAGASVSRSSLLASGVVVLERCITSVGGANDVRRRLQQRAFATLRPFHAITVDESLSVNDAADPSQKPALGATIVNTNGQVTMRQATFAGQIIRHKPAPEPVMTNITGSWSSNTRTQPFPLSEVRLDDVDDPGENANGSGITCTPPPTDLTCANGTKSGASVKHLRVPAGYTVTLAAGKYHFCDVTISGGTLVAAGTADVFVDHPLRETGGSDDSCDDAATTGRASVTAGVVNPAGISTPASVAPNLRLWIYGEDGQEGFNLTGSATTLVNALVYAPQSKVTVAKASGAVAGPTLTGAISAKSAVVTGNLTTIAGLANLSIVADASTLETAYEPEDWVECRRRPAPGKPHSLCRGS